MENLQEKIEEWLGPKLKMEELFLVEVLIGGDYKIKVFVDSDTNELTIRKCVRVSRHLEEFLDIDVEVADKYTLDVSSPGLENSLKIPRQYKKLIGKTLKIHTFEEEFFIVELLGVENNKIKVKNTSIKDKTLKGRKPKKLVLDETPFKIALIDIKRTKLHFEI
tara:strand:+ start:8111 stop:8602 length:492 start_codon:yes stop_codon:yes gene_type:complete